MSLVAGSMLGIGIFISPAQVAKSVSTPGAFFLVWCLGGLSALCGALCLAELGAMKPRSGGDYGYLREAYGSHVAFAAGWLQLLAIFPGSLASVAFATARFQLPVLFGESVTQPLVLGPISIDGPVFWAAVLIILLTAVNHVGVHISGGLQIAVTVIPLLVLGVASAWMLTSGAPPETATAVPEVAREVDGSITALARAFLPVYFAYSGWNAAIYLGGEIQDPGKNLPRALVGGTATVMGLYLLLCAGFLALFSLDTLASVGEAGTASAATLFGPVGVMVVTGLIFLAMLGSLNGTVFAGSRIAIAMVDHGDCFPAAGYVHPRWNTPTVGLWMQCGIAVALLATGSAVDQLIAYTAGAMLITGSLTVGSMWVFRKTEPGLRRPYRTFLHPVPALLYGLSSVLVLAVMIYQQDASVAAALAWFAAALIVHRLRQGRSPQSS